MTESPLIHPGLHHHTDTPGLDCTQWHGAASAQAMTEIWGHPQGWCGETNPHEYHDNEGTVTGRYSITTCPGLPLGDRVK